uniref:Uncharacterized protein LOC100182801 n=1 Tax=Phallusia mammillata TaxID=59560 RepID=A0A6F9DH19_9ASCI|nr:uncharacterized protein LOC100182801 [Phallusia mammillata]
MHETLPTAISTKSFGEAPWPSKGPRCNARCQNMDYSNDSDNRNTLLLRTLECKSTHTASCVTSTRRLRMEPMITNCKPNNITARSVAYVRTKMTRLKDEDILSGARGIKEPEVLHESHSQSTDAPLMPVPATKADGKTEILRVARFCERLIQQGPEHIRDNSVITECFEVGEETSSGPDIGGAADERMCCPRQCCKKLMKCQQRESFSNATFFTEDDAASVKEMMSEFSITPSRDARPDVTPVTPSNAREVSAKPPTANNEKEKGDALRVLANMFQGAPAPASGGQQHKAEDQNPAPTTTTSTCSGSDFLPQQVLIGRSESNRRKSEMELALKRVGKQFRQVIGRTKGSGDKEKNPKNSTSNAETDKAPGPSGNIRFGGGDFGSQLTEEWDESKHSYDVTPMTKSPRHQVPFKGLRFKLLVFGFLAALQLAEIGFVCAYKWKLNLFYPTSDDELGTIVSNGRMHCAVLSSILAALFYFVISIQLVALCSSAIERLQLICSGPSYRVDDYYQVG